MMYQKIFVLLLFYVVVTGENDSKSDADVDPSYARKRVISHNLTPTTTTRIANVGDTLVEKFVETLIASERYLKMIDSVQRKLTHLDSMFHERTNSIIKYSSEILRTLKGTAKPADLGNTLRTVVSDMDKLKLAMKDRNTRK